LAAIAGGQVHRKSRAVGAGGLRRCLALSLGDTKGKDIVARVPKRVGASNWLSINRFKKRKVMVISNFNMRASGVIFLAALATGCANQANGPMVRDSIQGAINVLGASLAGKPAGAAPDAPSESSFKDILVAESGSQWPRVALTITALQPAAYKNMIMTWGSSIPQNACMRLSAVVWSSAKKSRTIPEETFCVSQMRPTTINSNGEILAWGSFEDHMSKMPNTGHARNNGPVPPAKLFPEGGDYKNFYNAQASATFGVLIRTMGYDLSIDGVKDRRLWVVSAPSEAEINAGQKVLR